MLSPGLTQVGRFAAPQAVADAFQDRPELRLEELRPEIEEDDR